MKKKVLFVLEAFDKGGIEKVTLDIINNLDSQKYDITVRVIWFGGHCQSLVNKHIRVEPFFKKYRKGIMRLFIHLPKKILYRLYIREKYDVEIAAGDGIPSRIIAGSTNKKSKKVSWIHMDVLKRGSQLKELNNKIKAYKFYEPFDLIACVSNDCKKSFIRKFGFEKKVEVIYNPVPDRDIKSLAKEDGELKFDKSVMNIISVGRIVEQKGYDRLLEAHKRLIDENIRYHIYIIGDGNKRNELENYINKNELSNSVTLLGFKSNPYNYIKNCDLFVVSSRDEAFSIVLAEAIILNIPIISTKCSGPNELLNNGEFGLLVENSTEGIYTGLKEMITNKELYCYYENKVKERSKDFDFNNALNKFENIILK